jgi:hypothetical protein
MNVEIGTETPIFLFWEYLFRKFGILSLQCNRPQTYQWLGKFFFDKTKVFWKQGGPSQLCLSARKHSKRCLVRPSNPMFKCNWMMFRWWLRAENQG